MAFTMNEKIERSVDMKNVSLITTACQNTWPKNKDQSVLFLGEWCKIYSEKEVWQRFNSEVAPYHWDDRSKLYSDYQTIQVTYEKTLLSLSAQLNQIHQVGYSLRYWRILIGPWLGCFIHMLFDRWFMLGVVFSSDQQYNCTLVKRDVPSIVPNDMASFMTLFVEDDWNEAIYGQLIEMCWADRTNIEWVDEKNPNELKKDTGVNLKAYIKSFVSSFNALYTRQDDCFFISSYLPLSVELKLQGILGQWPKVWTNDRHTPVVEYNNNQRRWLLNMDISNHFERIVQKMIPLHIPVAYLEGYKALDLTTEKLSWPKRPKTIFTSNSFWADDIFKAWAARKTESGIPLVIGQHGGGYGMLLFEFGDDHQAKIANKWISWGWSDVDRPNIVPIGNLKVMGRRAYYNPKGGVLMVEFNVPRYSYHLYSAPIAGQWLDYFNEQKKFLTSLPKKLQEKFVLRLHHQDYGKNQAARWQDAMPELSIDSGAQDIKNLIQNSRLYIATYNGTTFLESLAWNIPTIIFWDPKYWELNERAKFYFDMLESVGVFHTTSHSAAQKMMEVWDDIDSWWLSVSVQNAREKFCEQYTRNVDRPVDQLKKIFTTN